MQHLNSCSTFCFESGVTSCNLHIFVYTPQKLSAVFMTYFPGLHCYPKKCLHATSLLKPFREFSLFLFAPSFFISDYCSDNSNKVFSSKLKFKMNFENSAFFSLPFGVMSRIISVHTVLKVSTIHWSHSQFLVTTVEGLGTSTWFKKKFMNCIVLKKKALWSLKISDTSCTTAHCHISEDF